jgi:hypothetical protein
MRLWTIHPHYLDPQGLLAVWREGLLAQRVLSGGTRGYRSHPQLVRFRAEPDPLAAIGAYLLGVHVEATRRGYRFDESKIVARPDSAPRIRAADGQLLYEWQHLLAKLSLRSPERFAAQRFISRPDAHPLFDLVPGPVASWERGAGRVRKP